jgi:hypothetical protein
MTGITEWSRDLLLSRGALVETDDDTAVRALLAPELAATLGSNEWLSLRFGAGAGADDEGHWLESLGRLLPDDARVIGARVRHLKLAPRIDPGAVLDRELVIQNGIYRLIEEYQDTARYHFFTFQYTIESDDTSVGVWTACVNASASSRVRQPDLLLNAVRDELEEDPAFAIPREELGQLYPMALRMARPEIRSMAAGIEQNANRRLARDSERIDSYYRDLLRQIEKRAARRSGDPQGEEKERGRAAAIHLDRAVKLEDLARKYSLKIRVEPGDVLVLSLPVRQISARIIRKKVERVAKLHWNPLVRALESPWCESCFGPTSPLYLCDDKVHFLCQACFKGCGACGRQYCRACFAKCRCGAVG